MPSYAPKHVVGTRQSFQGLGHFRVPGLGFTVQGLGGGGGGFSSTRMMRSPCRPHIPCSVRPKGPPKVPWGIVRPALVELGIVQVLWGQFGCERPLQEFLCSFGEAMEKGTRLGRTQLVTAHGCGQVDEPETELPASIHHGMLLQSRHWQMPW